MDKIKIASELLKMAKALVARVPQEGDEVRRTGFDELTSVDTIYSVDGRWVELGRGDMLKVSDIRWRGRYWQAK